MLTGEVWLATTLNGALEPIQVSPALVVAVIVTT
jgi:hypothetical protein